MIEKKRPLFFILNMLAYLCLFLGIYLILAWASFNYLDSGYSTANSSSQIKNLSGALGAWLMDFFYTFLGASGNLVPFLCLILSISWLTYTGKKPRLVLSIGRWIIGLGLLFGGLTVFTANFHIWSGFDGFYSSGGILGVLLNNLIWNLFPSIWLSLLLSIIAVGFGFLFCHGIQFCQWLRNVYNWVMLKPIPKSNNEAPTSFWQKFKLRKQQEEKSQIEVPLETSSTVVNNIIEPIAMAEELVDTSSVDNASTEINIYGLDKAENEAGSAPQALPVLDSNQVTAHTSANINLLNQMEIPDSENHSEIIRRPPPINYPMPEKIKDLPLVDMPVRENIIRSHTSKYNNEPSPADYRAQYALRQKLQAKRLTSKFNNSTADAVENSQFHNAENLAANLKISVPSMAGKDRSQFFNHSTISTENSVSTETENISKNSEGLRKDKSPLQVRIHSQKHSVEMTESTTSAKEEVGDKDSSSYSNSLIHPALQRKIDIPNKPTTPMPSLDLLDKHPSQSSNITTKYLQETSQRLESLLKDFGVKASVKDILVGPVVTRFDIELPAGVKASKVTNIESDLARALLFPAIRVAEVIRGKPYVGIETPNAQRQTVYLRDVLDSDEFRNAKSPLSMALGKDISNEPVVVDLAEMPHLLVAGATGSGKSVGVNTMILSLLFRVKPEEVKFIMIDPKVVELSVYNGIPHLLTEVVTDMKKASNALRWCVDEMERRYQLLASLSVRNIEGYNKLIEKYEALGNPIPNPLWKPGDTMDKMPPTLEKLPYIVVIVDEFADLMMMVGKQVEELIARLAQKARAIGIHLILATQRPSVDVITGLIKANVPTRIAFAVASKIDSRTILDQSGAEALLGRGDMLYAGKNSLELQRVHGAYMTDEEVSRVVKDWCARGTPNYIDGILDYADDSEDGSGVKEDSGEIDELFDEVADFVINTGTTSISSLQRKFRIGFNRAARIMDQLEEQGIVSAPINGKREVLGR